jgi:hypothetical protein
MSAIHEGESVRLLAAYSYGDTPGEWLPAGTVGRVVDVHGGGKGLAVEFTLREPAFGPSGEVLDYGKFELGYFDLRQVASAIGSVS